MNMAAILRSGKFLRVVSNLTRHSADERGQGHQGTNSSPLVTTAYSGSIQQHHSLSLQHLFNALPKLNPEKEQVKKNEDPKLNLLERRGSDPLLEFYVDKQKLEEAVKNFNVINQSHVGLNLVKELKDEKTENEPTTILVQKSTEIVKQEETEEIQPIVESHAKDEKPVQVIHPPCEVTGNETPFEVNDESVNENVKVDHPHSDIESIETNDATAETTEALAASEELATIPTQLVPLCQDPISHEWYPLP